MKEIERVTGPYLHTSGRLKGRKYLAVYYTDGTRGTTLYSRWLMEQHLGRRLDKDETVDHIDEDYSNDDITNLAVLTRIDNSKKSFQLRGKPQEWYEFVCPYCKGPGKKLARKVRGNRKQGKAGPFCSRECAGKWSNGSLV